MHGGGKTHPGHSNRVFALHYHKTMPNLLFSAGWDNTIQFYDMRMQRNFGYAYGPNVTGDALDSYGDLLVAGSYRDKEVVQLFSIGMRQNTHTIEWDHSSSTTSGFATSLRLSKPNPHLIFAAGAGRNEFKAFENNPDGSQTFKVLSSAHDFDSPILSMDVAHNGETIALGLQSGAVTFLNSKLNDEASEFEGYSASLHKAKDLDEDEIACRPPKFRKPSQALSEPEERVVGEEAKHQ